MTALHDSPYFFVCSEVSVDSAINSGQPYCTGSYTFIGASEASAMLLSHGQVSGTDYHTLAGGAVAILLIAFTVRLIRRVMGA